MATSHGKPDLHDHRFGDSPPLSLGVEEELLLVDAEGELVAASQSVLDSVPAPFAEQVSSEVFAEQIELKTDRLLQRRRSAAGAARRRGGRFATTGFELLGSGLHPTAASGEAALVDKPRYDVVREDFARPALDAALRAARPRRHPRPRHRGRARQLLPPLPPPAAGAHRQLPLPGGSRLRPRQRPRLGRARLAALPAAAAVS